MSDVCIDLLLRYNHNFYPKELLKCSKKAAVPNQADVKSLEIVVALVEVSSYSLCRRKVKKMSPIIGYCTLH